jgi:hypothetical protein
MHNIKSIFPLRLALLLLLAMIAINLSISTEVQAGPLLSLNPQPASQPSPPDNQSPDDDDDDGGEDDDDDGGEDDDSGGEDDDSGGEDEADENTPQPSPPDKEPRDDQDRNSEPTDYLIVLIDGCELTCSASFKEQTIELLARVQMIHEGSGFIVEGVISNLKSTRFSVPYPGKWKLFLMAQPRIISARPIDDPELRAAIAASFKGTPRLLGTVETNTSTPQFVKCPLICGVLSSGPASDRGVQPVFVDGNPQAGSPQSNCGFFNSSYREFRIEGLDSLGSGNYSDGFLSLDIVVTLSTTDGPSFDWSIAADSSVQALPGIFVKGGNGGNWYDYSGFTDVPDGGATYDGSLHSPTNPNNGKFYGLSHVSFCYQITPEGGVGDTDSTTPEGGNGVGDTHSVTTEVWMNSAADRVNGNIKPYLLPETGTVRFWDYPLVAVLIIGGLSLVVVGLHSYRSRP